MLLRDQILVPSRLAQALSAWQELEGLMPGAPHRAQGQELLAYQKRWEEACDLLRQLDATPAEILVLLAGDRWPARAEVPRSLSEALVLPRPYTQEMLAQSLGVSRQIVHKWYAGKAAPSPRHRKALEDIFGPFVASAQAPKWEQFIRSKGLWAEYEAFQ